MGKKKSFTARSLAVCGCLIALAFVMNNIMPKVKMPYGGSATLFSMLLIYLCSYFFGEKIGLTAAVAYGLLDLLINPSVVHPLQLLLDYPVAFGMLGIGGFLNKKKNGLQLGYLIGIIGRWIVCSISGAIFFGSYAPVGQSAIVYSTLYNGGYIFGEGIVTLAILFIPVVSSAIARLKKTVTE